jgi:uncharacterized phage-associated protein
LNTSYRASPMAGAKQIASWIVHYSANQLGAPVDPMSLEKHLYYAQAFYLVLRDRPLFADEILAWQKGPVVAPVYLHYNRFGWNPIIPDDDSPLTELAGETTDFLKQIIAFFGRYTGSLLSHATHLESPWSDARHDTDPDVPSGEVIAQHDMKAYYRALMRDGESALSRQEMLDLIPEPQWSSFYVAGICVRRMMEHPFYDAALATKLFEAIPRLPNLGRDFYKPSREADFVEFHEGDDIDDLLHRRN